MIDAFSPWFVFAVLGFALCTAAYWWMHDPGRLFVATIAVLVAACPCALSLATPTAFASANAGLRRAGIAPTSSSALERLPAVNRFVFDKTGTLSEDTMTLEQVNSLHLPEAEALQLAASLESFSVHPVAEALKAQNNLPMLDVDAPRNVVGKGVEGFVGGRIYRIGQPGWAMSLVDNESVVALQADVEASDTVLASSEGLVASFRLGETLRESAAGLLANLRREGYRVAILSGDNRARVSVLAHRLGLADTEFSASLDPQDKLKQIKALQAQGDVVAMVGDGLNDMPVMAGADVSISVSNASALNRNYADVVLLHTDLGRILSLVHTARRARRIIRQNIGWAVLYNALAMPLAAMALLPPWLAALGMSFSSLVVVLNSRRAGRVSVVSSQLPDKGQHTTISTALPDAGSKGWSN